MKVQIVTMLLLFNSMVGIAQKKSLIGDWYFINRNGIIQTSITKDSIISKHLYFDLYPKDIPADKYKYEKIAYKKNRVYVISRNNKGEKFFHASTLLNYVPGKGFYMAWNANDTVVRGTKALVKVLERDTVSKYGYAFFSKGEIEKIQQLKKVETMSKQEFAEYCRVFVQLHNETIREFDKYNYGYAGITYIYQITAQSLLLTGYNPIDSEGKLEEIYIKYASDPQLKEILKSLRTQ
jgi:hypothetical protein